MEPKPHKIADRYALCSLLGKGGMGSVHLAHDSVLNRAVAIKSLGNLGQENETRKQTALIEAQTLAQFNHASILKIYDVIHEEGQLWLVTELIDGKSLSEFAGKFSLEACFAVAVQILPALAIVHEKNIFHRDIKPQNILVAKDGRVVLIDFGVAYTPGSSGETITGSLNYIDPEVLAGKGAQAKSDLFSFGLVWLELLTQKKVVPDLAPLPLYQFFTEHFSRHVEDLCEGLFPPFRTALNFLLRQQIHRGAEGNDGRLKPFTGTRDLAEYFQKMWQSWSKLSPEGIIKNSLMEKNDSQNIEFIQFLQAETEKHLKEASLTLKQKSQWVAFGSRHNFLDYEHENQVPPKQGDLAVNRVNFKKILASFPALKHTAMGLSLVLVLSLTLIYFLGFSPTIKSPPQVASQEQNSEIKEKTSAALSSPLRASEENAQPPPSLTPGTLTKEQSGHKSPKPQAKRPIAASEKFISQCYVKIAANAWADIKIDGRPLGRIPRAEPFLLKAGKYTLSFSSPFIMTQEKKLALCDKKNVNIYVQLEHKQKAIPAVNTEGTPP